VSTKRRSRDAQPFHRCTHTALSPKQEICGSDGYGNSRVHKYDPGGRLLLSWGEPGCDPGQSNLPHNVCCDADGWVHVADRENHRIQVFDGNGRYETQWNNLHRPSGIFMTQAKCPICYIGEIGPYMEVNRETPNLGPRIAIFDHQGKLIGRLARTPSAGTGPGQFISPHGIAFDLHGDIYVGEVGVTAWASNFPGKTATGAAAHAAEVRQGRSLEHGRECRGQYTDFPRNLDCHVALTQRKSVYCPRSPPNCRSVPGADVLECSRISQFAAPPHCSL